MEPIPSRFRLTTKSETGLQCDAQGLFLGHTPLLERKRGAATSWRPRSADDLNRDMTERYGLPVDFSTKVGGLAAVGRALDRGDTPYAQMLALQLKLPDLPDPSVAQDSAKLAKIAVRLREHGLLTKSSWDESKHPSWPAGSPDSTGGEFAPAGEGSDTASSGSQLAGEASARESRAANRARTLRARSFVDRQGALLGTFLLNPPSETGGVIVQKVISTDKVYGSVVKTTVGWEAWEIDPGRMATGNEVDDTWLSPPPAPTRPSVATERTIVTEARFYEGITKQDLMDKYGFSIGGSGFSGTAVSTSSDPKLPTDNATQPLVRKRTFTKW